MEFDDNKDISFVLINNKVGERIFEEFREDIKWKETIFLDNMQLLLKVLFPEPDNKVTFWTDFLNISFGYITKKYVGTGFINKVKCGIVKIKRKLIG